MTRIPLSRSKGQGHQAALLTTALTHEAGAASGDRENVFGMELLLCICLTAHEVPTGEERGRDISCRHAHSLLSMKLFDAEHVFMVAVSAVSSWLQILRIHCVQAMHK